MKTTFDVGDEVYIRTELPRGNHEWVIGTITRVNALSPVRYEILYTNVEKGCMSVGHRSAADVSDILTDEFLHELKAI